MNWLKKSLTTVLAALTLFGTGISTPIVADDGDEKGIPAAETAAPVSSAAATASATPTAEVTATPTATTVATATPSAKAETTAVPTVEPTAAPTVEAAVIYPEFNYSQTVDSVVVTLHADEGILAKGTTAKISSVTTQVADGLNGKFNEYKAFDINLYDANGNIISNDSWNGKVSVTFSGTEIESMKEDADTVSVVNVDTAGNIQETKDITNETDNSVSFDADHFSIYVIGTETYRRVYNFYNGDQLIDTQTVKKGDVLLEPATPVANDGMIFTGWAISSSSVHQIFGTVTDTIANDGEIVNLYAQYVTSRYVFFVNTDGVVIATKSGVSEDKIETADVTFSVGSEEAITGWSTEKNGKTSVGNTVTLGDADITLYPIVEKGYWLTFNTNNGSGVSPVFYMNDTTNEPVSPTKAGYHFDGWYSDSNFENEYTFGSKLTKNTTVYAKWSANSDTEYRIIYWIENADDEKYTFEKVGTGIGTTDSSIVLDHSIISENQINDDYSQFFKYNYNDSSNKTVNADGSTVVNVYYSRNSYSVKFDLGYNSSNEMTIAGKTYSGNSTTEYTLTAKYDSDISNLWPTASNFQENNSFYGWSIPGSTSIAVSKKLTMTADLCSSYGITAKANYGTTCSDHLYYMFESLDQSSPASGNERILYKNKYYDKSIEYSQDANSQGGNWQQKTISGLKAVGTSEDILRYHYNNWHSIKILDERNVFLYYDRLAFSLTFIPNDGTSIADQIIKLGDKVKNYKPSSYIVGETTKSIDGQTYIFTGWYNNIECAGNSVDFSTITMPANNVSYYAGWDASLYTAKIYNTDPLTTYAEKTNLKYGDKSITDEYLSSFVTLSETQAIRGWYYVENGVKTNRQYKSGTMVTSDFAIAPYIVDVTSKCTVSYSLDGGAGTLPVDNTIYAIDAEAKVLAPSAGTIKDGKVFIGWSDGKIVYQPNDVIIIKGNTVLTAVFGDIPSTTSLTYNAGYENADPTSVQHTVLGKAEFANNTELTLYGKNTFTREGYTLIGWNSKEGQSDAEFSFDQTVGVDNLSTNTLYGVWKKNLKVTITADSNGGEYTGLAYTVSTYTTSVPEVTFADVTVVKTSQTDVGKALVKFATNSPKAIVGSDGNTYDVTYIEGIIEVTAKAVTVTANDKSKTYGEADPTLDAEVSGTIGDDKVTYTISRTAGENAGTYAITPAGEASQGNYAVTYKAGTLTINRAGTMTVAGTSYKEAYDGQTHGKAASASVTEGTTVKYSVDGGKTWTEEYPTIINVGKTEVTVKASNDNYTDAEATYTLEVTAKAVTVTANDKSKTYGEADPTLDAEVSGTIGDDKVTYTISRTAGENAGTYAITPAGEASQGNYAVTYKAGTLTINRAGTMTVAGTSYKEAYDGQTHGKAASASVTEGTTVKYSVDGGKTWTEEYPTIINVGKTEVTVKASNDNYTDAEATYTLEVTAKAVTVTANDKSKTYGEADPTLDAEVSGTIGDDKVTYTISRTAGENAGTYAITPAGEASQGNYAVTYKAGTLTINRAGTMTVAGTSYKEAYDGQTHGKAASASVTEGTTVKYSVDGGKTWTEEYPTIINVGKTEVTVKASNDNYTDAEATYTLEVTAKAVTVTANDKSKTYGEADPTLDAEVSGTIGDDKVTYTISRTAGENAGTYAITPAGEASQGNYAVTYKAGTLTINRAGTMTVAGTSYKEAYDGQTHGKAASASVTEGTTVKYSVDGGKTWTEEYPTIINVGKTEVTVKASNDNYTDAEATYTLEVTAKAVTVTANDKSKTYGEADPTLDAEVSGTIGDDKVTYTISRTAGENAGTYAITPAGEASQGNYAVTYKAGTLTINRAGTMTVAGTSYKEAYDGQTHGKAASASVTEGTTVKYSVDGGKTWTEEYPTIINVGKTEVTVKASNDNYTDAEATYTLEVTAKAVTVTANDKSKTYGEADPTLDAEVSGTIGDDKVTYTISRTAGENAGTYAITPAGEDTQGNYAVTYKAGTLTINRAGTMTVAGTSYKAAYDGQKHGTAASASVTEGTTVKYSVDGGKTWTEEYPTIINVGKTEVTVKASNDNYTDAEATYTLEVTAKAVTVTANDKSKTYGEADPTLDAEVSGTIGDDKVIYTISRTAGENAGTYAITPAGEDTQGNYNVTYEPADFTIIASNKNGVFATGYTGTYDGSAHSITAKAAQNGSTLYYSTDNHTWSETLPEYTDAAETKTVYVKAVNSNYEDALGQAEVTINKRNVTLTSGTSSKRYDGTALTNENVTVSGEGFVTGEGAEYTVTGKQTEAGTSENAFTYAMNAETKADNYNVTVINGTLTVTERPATPITPDEPDQPVTPVTPETPERPTTPTTTDRPHTPNTGDQTNAGMAAGAFGFSILAAALAIFFKKKYSE